MAECSQLASGIGTHSPSGGYKQESKFDLLDGSGATINSYTLKNSWPINISQGKLTYTDTEIKIVTVTLAYDWAEGIDTAKNPSVPSSTPNINLE